MQIFTANHHSEGFFDKEDISMGSGSRMVKRLFGPGWDLVNSYKTGKISAMEYRAEYWRRMRESYKKYTHEWKEFMKQKRVTLTCFCPQHTDFCHRYVLAEIFEKMGHSVESLEYDDYKYIFLTNQKERS